MKSAILLLTAVLLLLGCRKWFEAPRREIELQGRVVDQFDRPVPNLELILGENGGPAGLGERREPTYQRQSLKTDDAGIFSVTFADRTPACPATGYLSRVYTSGYQVLARNDSLFRYEIDTKTLRTEPTCLSTARGYQIDLRIFVTEFFIK